MNAPEKAKRQPTRYNIKWLFIIGCIVFLCGSCGVFEILKSQNPYSRCFHTLFPSYEDVEKQAHFKLSKSARSVEYFADGNDFGCTFIVKFEIKPQDFDAFQASTLIKSFDVMQIDHDSFFDILEEKGWIERSLLTMGYDGRQYIDNGFQHVFIDTADKDTFVIYLMYSYTWIT